MKKIKTLISFLLLISLVCGLGVTANASSVTFNGFDSGFDFEPGSEYTSTDLFENFKDVMPGDVLTDTITFTNNASDSDFVNLYMKAETKNENDSETLDFLSKLSLKVYNGTDLIYDDSADDTGSLTDFVLLGTYRSGETATLTAELSVPVSLGNEYADRIGEVDWIFHVEAYNESQLTARKVWSDGNDKHEGNVVTVNLLKDGKTQETVELSPANNWAYTFDKLLEGHDWSVEEANVPSGYEVSYETVGNVTTILNKAKETPTPTPANLTDLTVTKSWSGDSQSERPSFVTVTLYNGQSEYQTVKLDSSNNWSYTWKSLDGNGNWQVLESNIPNGYTPSYSKNGSTINITNTRSLVQTGQNNFPVIIFGACGLALVLLGILVLRKKKNDD